MQADRYSRPNVYLSTLCAALLLLFMTVWGYTTFERDRFLTENYGVWRANMLNIKTCKTREMAVIGASQANVGFLPSELRLPMMNYTLPASTPVEGYFMVRNLYRCPSPPKVFVLSYAAKDFALQEFFWPDGAGYGLLGFDELQEVAAASRLVGDHTLYGGQFGSEPPPAMKNWLYATHFPPFDFASLVAAGPGGTRKRRVDTAFNITMAHDGERVFGNARCGVKPNFEADKSDIATNKTSLYYFHKMLELLKQHNATVLFVSPPMKQATYDHMQASYRTQYAGLLQQLGRQGQDMTMVGPVFPVYDNCLFTDESHLNGDGMRAFDRSARPLILQALSQQKG